MRRLHRIFRRGLVSTLLIQVLASSAATATDLIVTTTADVVDANDGLTSLREAIAYANTLGGSQTITFSNNTANGAVNFHDGTARTITVSPTNALPNLAVETTIVGPGSDRLTVSASSGFVFAVSGSPTNPAITLSGLTLAGSATVGVGNYGSGQLTLMDVVAANFSGPGIQTKGAVIASGCSFAGSDTGIWAFGGTGAMTVTDCDFSGCTNTGIRGGTGVTALRCTFDGTTNSSAGIFQVGGAVTATGCTFAKGNSGINGATSVMVTDCSFTESQFAGVFNVSGPVNALRCSFTSHGNSGIISARSASIADCTITGNQTTGISQISGLLVARNCLIRGDGSNAVSAGAVVMANCEVSGGSFFGISSGGQGLVLTNCTVVNSGNSALVLTNDVGSVTNCTIVANVVGISGAGNVTLANSIVAGGSLANISGNYGDGGHNLLVPTPAAAGLPVDGTGAVVLQNNSGPTNTVALLQASPALDGGDNSRVGLDPATGQSLTVSGGAGTFTLSFAGQTTNALAWNAAASAVQAELATLTTIGGTGGTVEVTATSGGYAVTFGGSLADTIVPILPVGSSGATVSLTMGLTPLTTDQRGQSRVRSATVDIGAFESAPARLYVSQSVPGGGNGSGETWPNAMPELRTATAMAQTDPNVSEIWVARGTYLPAAANSGDRAATFRLRSGLAIYGGFSGGETQLSQRSADPAITVLSGDLNGNDGPNFANNGENSYHVVTGSGTDVTAVLDGFTVERGRADGRQGGGIHNSLGSPILRNLIVKNNSADAGGGIYNISSTPTLSHVAILGNLASTTGGGIFNNGCSPVLTNVILSGNSATLAGGGMHNTANSPTLTNVTFSGNAAGQGGALYNVVSGRPTLRNCILWGNSGGEISDVLGSSATMNNSIVQGGYAGSSDVDPLFITPITEPAPTTTGNLRLRSTSPAINAGDNSVVTASTDLDGAARIIGATVDLGAYELIVAPTLTNTQLTTVNGGTLTDLAALTGAAPDGGVFSGTGVSVDGNGRYVFDSTGMPFGTQVTVTYAVSGPNGTSNEATFTITVTETPSLTVTTTSDTSTNTDGLTSLREAIAFANSGNAGPDPEIAFGNGAALGGTDFTDAVADTILLSGNHLNLTASLTITGRGADKTIVDGNQLSRIFLIDDGTATEQEVEITGLTVQGGNGRVSGGAIHNAENFVMSDTVFSQSYAEYGGIIYNTGTATMQNCITSGARSYAGGAIYNTGMFTLIKSRIADGVASLGGGIFNEGTFVSNGNIVINNEVAIGSGGEGGGVFNLGHFTSTNDLITENVARSACGGVLNTGTFLATNVTITKNVTLWFALENRGTISTTNVSITNNTGSLASSGVGISGNAVWNARNTIVAGNSVADVINWAPATATINADHLIIGDLSYSGPGVINTAPVTVAELFIVDADGKPLLADYGGATPTIALAPGSPAIDAGDNTLALDADNQPLTTDQRGNGFPRITKGLAGSSAATVDLGAFEVFGIPTFTTDVLTVISGSGTLDLAALTGATPSGGSFSGTGVTGSTFDPTGLALGSYTVTYTVSDGFGTSNSATFAVTVAEVPSLTVTTTSDTSTNTDGLTSLREAIAFANSGNAGPDPEITFGNGLAQGGTDFTDEVADTILLSGNQLHVTGSMTITGRGAEKTIVDGNQLSAIFLIDDSTATKQEVEITGLTVQHGWPVELVGGIANSENLTVSECVISGNRGFFCGGIFNYGDLTLTESRMTSNRGYGAGAVLNNGTLTSRHNTFEGNRTDGDGGGGGAISNSGSLTSTISTHDVYINNSSYTDGGGAVYNEKECTFRSTNCSFVNNSTEAGAGGSGGGAVQNEGIYTSTNDIFIGNSGVWRGGAIVNRATLTTINTTIAGNRAPVGGGIVNSGRSDFGHPTWNARNTLLAGNTGGEFGTLLYDGSTSTINADHTIIGDLSYSGPGVINTAPVTVAELFIVDADGKPLLADYGGATPTIALAPGSPAIDAGDNTLALDADNQPLTTDQRGNGFPRIRKGLAGSSAATVDLGAFELLGIPTFTTDALTVISGSGTLDLAALTGAAPSGGSFSGTGVTGSTFDSTGLALGQYTVTYTVNDGFGTSNSATFTVTVAEVPGLTVTTTSDTSTNIDGLTSLREAIAYANSGNAGADPEITFGNGLAQGGTDFTDEVADTILLSGEHLHLTASITITGRGAEKTIVDGNQLSRIFLIDDGTATEQEVEITGLTVQNGERVDKGGGTLNAEKLTLSRSVVSGCTSDTGGNIFNKGTMTVWNCTVSNCRFANSGAGIYNEGVLVLIGSRVENNTAFFGAGIANEGILTSVGNVVRSNQVPYDTASGGGIYISGGQFSSTNDLITGNFSDSEGGGVTIEGGTFISTNVTITNNSARFGGGVFNANRVLSRWIAHNTVVVGSTGGDFVAWGGTVNADHVIIGDLSYSGPGVINTAPVTVASSSSSMPTANRSSPTTADRRRPLRWLRGVPQLTPVTTLSRLMPTISR